MVDLTHSEKVMAEKTVCVLLVRGTGDAGQPIFAYVGVRADKLDDFMKAQADGTFYPEDYGVVIESGEGEPSEEIRTKMETEYGFNHDGMIDIPSAEGLNDVKSAIFDHTNVDKDKLN